MAVTKKKKSKDDSRKKRLFSKRSKQKGHRIKSKQEVDDELEKQKFEENIKENEHKEKLLEKKRKLNDMMQEQRERRKVIRDTFKGIHVEERDDEDKVELEGNIPIHKL